MNYFVVITENGTEKIPITDSYSVPSVGNSSELLQALSQHISQVNNVHQTSLQQVVTKQGNLPLENGFRIGSTDSNENLLTILKDAIYFAINGTNQHTNIDVNGFYHVSETGQVIEINNGGIRLTDNGNTITVNFDGTITGLKESTLYHSAATRGYVESLALGLKPHAPVRIMLEKGVDVQAFYFDGSGVGKTLTAVENGLFHYQDEYFGVGERIGVKCFGYQRRDAGIYTITHLGDENSPWVLTRATDFDGSTSFETKQSDILFVESGRFARCMFIETERGSEPDTGNLIIDTDLVTWELFHKPQDFIFEQGVQQIGQNISVKPDIYTGETIIPVSVSANGVGVQKSIITDIAEIKKQEAILYTDQQSYSAVMQSKAYTDAMKVQSDIALQNTYVQTQNNDQVIKTECNAYALQLSQNNTTYTNQQITSVRNLILNPIVKPSLFPQFFLLNGQMLQNYSDYLYYDNAYRSGNDGGLNSNNCLPFMMPEIGTLVGISLMIGAVGVGGTYVANTEVSINFQIREMAFMGSLLTHSFTIPAQGPADRIGSNGGLPSNPIQQSAGITGLNIPLYNSRLYGIKFIHTLNSAIIASTIKNVVIVLEIKIS